MFLKDSAMEGANFMADLLDILQILTTPLHLKNTKKVVKSGSFENFCVEERQFFFKIKEAYKVSCVKICFTNLLGGWYLCEI